MHTGERYQVGSAGGLASAASDDELGAYGTKLRPSMVHWITELTLGVELGGVGLVEGKELVLKPDARLAAPSTMPFKVCAYPNEVLSRSERSRDIGGVLKRTLDLSSAPETVAKTRQ